ncbi:uncharacterized protein LOC131636967 [Vicia villosa]|uniref:uncharacterized protein LOC131636967 n=1 Tax=Vicia villosa TaxID=3911 RepID=UPI00273B3F99|nr:uncharacterized protein LOC131636967 [Vicia villosa]
MSDAPAGSSFALRSRLSQASFSREVEELVHEEDEVPKVHPEHDEDTQDAQEGGYPGGPSNTSILTYYHDHAARHIWNAEAQMFIKSVSHSRKIYDLFKPQAQWFNDVVAGSCLGGLCCTGYVTISHDMQWEFVERWHKETSSFHFLVGS